MALETVPVQETKIEESEGPEGVKLITSSAFKPSSSKVIEIGSDLSQIQEQIGVEDDEEESEEPKVRFLNFTYGIMAFVIFPQPRCRSS